MGQVLDLAFVVLPEGGFTVTVKDGDCHRTSKPGQ